MADLTANQRSFIEMMQLSDEHATRGFELILKQPKFFDFFNPLKDAGLFAADKNPAPVQADEEGRYRIPYWKALDYLVACAKVAGERNDAGLAERILGIIRTVDAERDPAGDRANFHTFRRFAEILGLLPTASVTHEDLGMVEGWLNAKFGHDMVAHALDDGALPHFLSSSNPTDWEKAVTLFTHCVAIRWQPDRLDSETREPVTLIEEHWLRRLVNNHAMNLGRRTGPAAAALMIARVREVFGEGGRANWSHIFRPAVEEQGDSRQARGVENIVVEGLRDVLMGWTEVDASRAKPVVDGLIRSDTEMLRRVGIHILNERWESLGDLYPALVRPELFRVGHLHELYRLLNLRFESFEEKEKHATIAALRDIPVQEGEDQGQERVEHLQFRWLSAISDTSFEPATKWFGALTAKHGAPPRHPDYLSRIETRWGPGPSQYSAEELGALAEQGTLVQKLAAFKPSNAWEGPTVDALTDQLERAVQIAPTTFARVLPDLSAAPIPYLHAVVAGFVKLWREPNAEHPFAGWDDTWPDLFDFFEALLASPAFWNKRADVHGLLEVTPMWIASSIADLLHAGTRADSRAYPAELLPRGWGLLQALLAHSEAASEPSDDPMFQTINSTRGRALEAVFSHALRVCRLADAEGGAHVTAWGGMQALFDAELAACANGNFEFSTLAGAYSGNLEYLSSEWLEANIEDLFPIARPANLLCAIGGLAYASTSRKIHQLLRDSGVFDAALRLDVKGRNAREKLIERLAVGYLWGEDSLDSSRFTFIFASDHEEDLAQISFFLRTLREEQLTADHIQRILEYWSHVLAWADGQPTPPVRALSSLSGLATFLPDASGQNYDLLVRTAPHVHEHHGAYEFLNDLLRLVEGHPKEVSAVLRKFIDAHGSMYDYEDRMRRLVGRLAELGYRSDAIEFCDKLRSVPGLYELFRELTANPPDAT